MEEEQQHNAKLLDDMEGLKKKYEQELTSVETKAAAKSNETVSIIKLFF